MSAEQLIETIRDSGGSLRLADGRVKLGNLATLPASIIQAAREQKLAIVALLERERQPDSGAADVLKQAGVRLPELPGARRAVAVPRSTWSTAVADALSPLGSSDLPVVLLDRRYESGDPAMSEAAWKKVRTGEFFEQTSAVDIAVRWFAPRWPERFGGQGQVSCRDDDDDQGQAGWGRVES